MAYDEELAVAMRTIVHREEIITRLRAELAAKTQECEKKDAQIKELIELGKGLLK